MDLRVFFQKVKEMEHAIPGNPVVVVSEDTPDGGRAGGKTEVSRALAAKLIVEGRARLATEQETAGYRAAQESTRQQAEERALAGRVTFNLVPQSLVPQTFVPVNPAPPVAAPAKEPKKPAKE